MMTRSKILSAVFTQLKDAGYVYNKQDFARRLNYSSTYLSPGFSGKRETNLSDKLFATILKVFPQVNETFIRTGLGSVLRDPQVPCPFTGILLKGGSIASLLHSLHQERESLLADLEKVDRMISSLSERNMKSLS